MLERNSEFIAVAEEDFLEGSPAVSMTRPLGMSGMSVLPPPRPLS